MRITGRVMLSSLSAGRSLFSARPVDAAAMTPVALIPLLTCWAAGVLLATAGRRYAARTLAGANLPFRQVLTAQLVGTALNRVVPAGGGLLASHAALLRRRGSDGPHLAGALGGYAAGGALAHLLLAVGALIALATGLVTLPGAGPALPALPGLPWIAAAAAVLAVAVLALLRGRPELMVRAAGFVRQALGLLRSQPAAVLHLAVVQSGTALVAAGGLWAALWATGTSLPLLTVLVVYLLTNTVAGALPVPGGTGPMEAGLIAALGLVGVALVPAAAAVVLFRLVTHWMPVPLGLAAAAALAAGRGRLPMAGGPTVAVL